MENVPAKENKSNDPVVKENAGSSLGNVRVHENVISSIVRKTVLETAGVIRFAGSSFVDNIAELVGSRAIQDRAITVEMGDGIVSVEVRIVTEYGVFIPDIAKKIQASLRSRLPDLTGMKVGSVCVDVMDIEFPQEKNEEDSES